MVMTLFFLWGFITCLNDILIPHLKSVFTLSYAEVMLVQTFFFAAYSIFAIPASKVVDWIGYKWTLVTGLLVMAIGAVSFIPAAMAASFPLFLVALAIVAGGINRSAGGRQSLRDRSGAGQDRIQPDESGQRWQFFRNHDCAVRGQSFDPGRSAADGRRVGRLSQPALHAYQVQQAAVVKLPYLVIAAILVSYAIVMALYKLPKMEVFSPSVALQSEHGPSIWHQRHLLLAVIAIFFYVGTEVSVGSFMVNYLNQPYIGNIPEKTAAIYVALYWGGLMVGRILEPASRRGCARVRC